MCWGGGGQGVRDQFRLGGLRSVARIFYPLLARKSSGFARILHDLFFIFLLLPEYGYFKNSRGGSPSPPPPPRTPMGGGVQLTRDVNSIEEMGIVTLKLSMTDKENQRNTQVNNFGVKCIKIN